MALKILFIGDVVGSPGRKTVSQVLPRLIRRWDLGLVVCNAENAAGGSGLTVRCHEELAEAGVDVFTLGDHVYRKDEVFNLFEQTDRLLRPANFPPDSPGETFALAEARDGTLVGVFTLLGRTYMRPVDCPFRAADRVLEQIRPDVKVIIVDIHAEATSEKMAMGHFCDGRASLVVGTHSHVPTADCQILPGGTAYQTDAGACADYDSVIGNDKEEPLRRFTTRISQERYKPASGPATVCGVYVETDDATGLARRIEPIRVGGRLAQTIPSLEAVKA